MDERDDVPPMKPVRADEVRVATSPLQSPKHLLLDLTVFVVCGAAMFVAVDWLRVPLWAAVAVGGAIVLARAAADMVRWHRKRRL